LVISLTDSDFQLQGYKPVIDIVCIDSANLVFQVDIIGRSLTNNG
jgi:hypothetical protein